MAALVTIKAVPIARVGVWEASTGRWDCTRGQLEDAVRASRDSAFRAPVLKLGHEDPRFDGTPAVGRLANLRLDASGEVLLADLVGVPAPLAEILNSAYPSRSVEALVGVVTASGDRYGMVVTGLALLGDTPPAIESLGDVFALFDQPEDVDDWVAASRVAASIDREGTTMTAAVQTTPPRPVAASATIEELVTAAEQYAAANGVAYAWVREIYTDRVIVASDEPPMGRLWELGWSEGTDGLAFTGPYPVKIEYTRLAASAVAAAAHRTLVPLHCRWGRGGVSASTPEEHPPVSDLAAQVREQLGLDPGTEDDAVLSALAQRLGTNAGQQGTPQTDQTGDQGGQGGGDAAGPTTVNADPQGGQQADVDNGGNNANQPPAQGGGNVQASALERLVAARVAAAVRPFEQKLEETTRELADRKERERVQARDALFASALAAGKVTPAEVDGNDGWRAQYDASPEGAAAVTRMLSKVSAGAAVPVNPTPGAHTGGAEPGEEFGDADYYRLFPDEAPKGANV